MKIVKKIQILLDEDDPIKIGLLTMTKKKPVHEFFFELNQREFPFFFRNKDFEADLGFSTFYFQNFQIFNEVHDFSCQIISNKSFSSGRRKNSSTDIFVEKNDFCFLIDQRKDVDFIVRSDDIDSNFFLNLRGDGAFFEIERFCLAPDHFLYQNIRMNE